jgi:mxaA protein
MTRPMHAGRCARLVVALVGATAMLAAAGEPATLQLRTAEPRAYGYQVGDVLQRRIAVDLPEGLALDEASVPRPGARGRALELRAVHRTPASGREEIVLEYQVFLAPPTVRTLELPPVVLHFTGRPRAQDVRIDAWPVTIAPLVPVEVSPRRGLGDLQPDVDAPHLPTDALRTRVAVWLGGAALLVAALALLHFGLPWWNRRHRPFARAWIELRRLRPAADDPAAWRLACERLHAAFNESGGEVLFEHGIERFAARRPGFAPLREEVRRFLAISRRGFFGDGVREPGDLAWLVGFGRRCRDAERWS